APQHEGALHEHVDRRGGDLEAANAPGPAQQLGHSIQHRSKGSRRDSECAIVRAMSDQEPILVEQDGRVVTVTFNRAEARNAMTFEMYETLHALCEKFDTDPAVRVIVLTGAGDQAFVSGTDRAREIVLTARLVSAADAKAMGLVDEVHPATALRGRVKELAAHIAELAPLTLAATKEAVRRMIAANSPGSLEDLLLSCYLS